MKKPVASSIVAAACAFFSSWVLAEAVAPASSPESEWRKVTVSSSEQLVAALVAAGSTGVPTTVVIRPGIYRFESQFDTHSGPSLLPPVATRIFVVGAGTGKTTLDGSGRGARFFTVAGGGALVVRQMTLMSGGLQTDIESLGGGAVANFGGFLRMDDCVLVANGTGAETGALGGAILSKDGRLHLERVTLTSNAVDGWGGAIAIVGGTGVIRDSIISGNQARVVAGAGAGGGGLYVANATVTVTGSTVSGNRAERNGGGILNEGTIWLTNSAVIENAASDPGHRSYGGGVANYGLIRIRNGSIGLNTAGTYGGGLFNAGRLFLRGGTITRNSVDGDIGAGGCDPQIAPCYGGGGLWNATTSGASVAVFSSARSAIAQNQIPAHVGGSPLDSQVAVGPDCAGVFASEGRNALGDGSGCDVRASYVLQGGPTYDLIGVAALLGELQDNGDAGHGHFPLLVASPLIDAGGDLSDYCGTFDQIGQSRTDGDGDGVLLCDIGAVEFQQ